MKRTPAALRRHRITLQNSSAPVPDGDGGSTSTWTDLSPAAVNARIESATTARLERVAAGTSISAATHIVTMPYHAGVTTKTRITYEGRRFEVTGVSNPEEQNVETVCVCEEVVA